jgi:hypothetical protein
MKGRMPRHFTNGADEFGFLCIGYDDKRESTELFCGQGKRRRVFALWN